MSSWSSLEYKSNIDKRYYKMYKYNFNYIDIGQRSSSKACLACNTIYVFESASFLYKALGTDVPLPVRNQDPVFQPPHPNRAIVCRFDLTAFVSLPILKFETLTLNFDKQSMST